MKLLLFLVVWITLASCVSTIPYIYLFTWSLHTYTTYESDDVDQKTESDRAFDHTIIGSGPEAALGTPELNLKYPCSCALNVCVRSRFAHLIRPFSESCTLCGAIERPLRERLSRAVNANFARGREKKGEEAAGVAVYMLRSVCCTNK